MRLHSLAAAVAATFAVSAPAYAQSAQDWAGPYVGGHLGYTVLDDEDGERVDFDTNLDGSYGDVVRNTGGLDVFSPGFCGGANRGNNAGAGCTDDEGNLDYGLRAGYDWSYRGLVLGVVGEVSFHNVNDDASAFTTTPAGYTFKRSIDTMYALRGRVGIPIYGALAYATAGYAQADIERTFSSTNALNSFTPRGGDDGKGYQVGLGAERKLGAGPLSLGAEYLYTSLDDEGYVVRFGQGAAAANHPFVLTNPNGTDARRSSDTFDLHSFRVTATYRFNN